MTTAQLILHLVKENPSWTNQQVADEVCRRMPGARTSAASVSSTKSRAKRGHTSAATPPSGAWPEWDLPSQEALLVLLRTVAGLVRFLDPAVVSAVVEDNRRMSPDWTPRLAKLGVDPAAYLWEGSPCTFPGVRRHSGQEEISLFKRNRSGPHAASECLALDDNDYPLQFWARVLTGRPFNKLGPPGYHLAHLFEHKTYGGRWREELEASGEPDSAPALHGLFTSAANTVFVPSEFLRPTDSSPLLRQLLQRRVAQLYGNVCTVAPPPYAPRIHDDPASDPGNFHWRAPVGTPSGVDRFLQYRRGRMDSLLRKKEHPSANL